MTAVEYRAHAGVVTVRGAVVELLGEAAAVRERLVDDHMFAVDLGGIYPATFRLQLFTAPGVRPVAVVVQATSEGPSLVNAGERYAEAVWKQHCPDELEPPIWIERFLLPRYDNLAVITFRRGEGVYQLSPAARTPITVAEIGELVGRPVDTERGEGFVPRPSEQAEQIRYCVELVVRLPRPSPFREPTCMPVGTPWWRRIGRQIITRRSGSECCWYHQGDWHAVSKTAIRLDD